MHVRRRRREPQPTAEADHTRAVDRPVERHVQTSGEAQLTALQSTIGNQAVGRMISRTGPVIRRTMDDVLEKLSDWITTLHEAGITDELIQEYIVALGFDTKEQGDLPSGPSIAIQIQSRHEQATAPKSPYTGEAYTDQVYVAHRASFAEDLGLDTIYHSLDPGARIDRLFGRFCARKFTYTMQAGGIDVYAKGQGDCKTLATSFAKIAKQEFGLDVTVLSEVTPFLVPGRVTIDPNAKGNCNGGSQWFFDNHYWADFDGSLYDLLFMARSVDTGAFDRVEQHGERLVRIEDDALGPAFRKTSNGRYVWDGPEQKAGVQPDNYRSGTEADLGTAGFKLP